MDYDYEKHCHVCRGSGVRHLSWGRMTSQCRPCKGTGEYPDPTYVASLLDEREIEAHFYCRSAALHRDGMIMVRLAALGLCSGSSRSGDNASPLNPLGYAVKALLRPETLPLRDAFELMIRSHPHKGILAGSYLIRAKSDDWDSAGYLNADARKDWAAYQAGSSNA